MQVPVHLVFSGEFTRVWDNLPDDGAPDFETSYYYGGEILKWFRATHLIPNFVLPPKEGRNGVNRQPSNGLIFNR